MASKHEEKKGEEHHDRKHNFIFTAKADTIEPLKKALIEHGKVVRKQEGCHHVKIYQSKTAHDKFVVLEDWADHASEEHFFHSNAYAHFRIDIHDMFGEKAHRLHSEDFKESEYTLLSDK